MPTQTTLSRVESFPFDSRSDGYDADGYPVYDRAVGASMLRATFEKFFSDGVFPSPGNALQISKGSGLTVTIQPGIFIINGAMGGYLTDAHSLTLDTAAPQGNVCYGIMLRYDETEQYRSCYVRVVRGDAASTPQPPEPDQTTPGVMEYRLGYVKVPSGATDLTSATVTNEKGLSVCPYAAPFEEIDMSEVTADARNAANEALTQLLAYFDQYRDMVDAAIDETLAGQLQEQISQLKEQVESFSVDLASEVDDFSIEYTSDNYPTTPKKLRVKDGGIVHDSLSQWLQIELGIADTESWDYDDFKSMAQASQGDETLQTSLVGYLDQGTVTSWTDDQIVEFAGLLVESCQTTFVGYISNSRAQQMAAQKYVALYNEVISTVQNSLKDKVNLMSYPWDEMHVVHKAFGDSWASKYVGQTKSFSVQSETYQARLIGVAHDEATDGDGPTLAFQATESLSVRGYYDIVSGYDTLDMDGYASSTYADKVSESIELFESGLRDSIREVKKSSVVYKSPNYTPVVNNLKVWAISGGELCGGKNWPSGGIWHVPEHEGGQYEYWATKGVGNTVTRSDFISRHGDGSKFPFYGTRTCREHSDGTVYIMLVLQDSNGGGYTSGGTYGSSGADIVPCFCI